MKISKVVIKGYRALSEINLKTLNLNIIVGLNNTGKSSFLEAILVGLSSLDGFYDLLGNNTFSQILRHREPLVEYLINTEQDKSYIELDLEDVVLNKKLVPRAKVLVEIAKTFKDLDLIKGIGSIPFSKLSRLLADNLFMSIRPRIHYKQDIPLIKLRYIIYGYKAIDEEENCSTIYISNIIKLPNIEKASLGQVFGINLSKINIVSQAITEHFNVGEPLSIDNVSKIKFKSKGFSPVLFINEKSLYIERQSILMDRIIKEGLKMKFLENVNKILRESGMETITDISYMKPTIYVSTEHKTKPLPLGYYGDGVRYVVSMVMASTLVRDYKGVLVIEEPEIHMHPKLMEALINYIVDLSNDVQIFVSTQSPDFLRYLSASLSDRQYKMISLHHFIKSSSNRIKVVSHYGKDAISKLEYIAESLYTIA